MKLSIRFAVPLFYARFAFYIGEKRRKKDSRARAHLRALTLRWFDRAARFPARPIDLARRHKINSAHTHIPYASLNIESPLFTKLGITESTCAYRGRCGFHKTHIVKTFRERATFRNVFMNVTGASKSETGL